MFYANTLKPGTRNNYGHFLLIAAVCSLDFVTHKGFQTTFYLSISCCDLFKFVMFNSAFMPHVAFPSLLEGHQTCSVKSKSVSDADFPDQSECTIYKHCNCKSARLRPDLHVFTQKAGFRKPALFVQVCSDLPSE